MFEVDCLRVIATAYDLLASLNGTFLLIKFELIRAFSIRYVIINTIFFKFYIFSKLLTPVSLLLTPVSLLVKDVWVKLSTTLFQDTVFYPVYSIFHSMHQRKNIQSSPLLSLSFFKDALQKFLIILLSPPNTNY